MTDRLPSDDGQGTFRQWTVTAGMAMGQAMTQSLGAAGAPQPPAAAADDTPEARLEKLKALLERGLISQADYDDAKAKVLQKLIG